jgi:glutathione S-transferase
VLNYKHIPYRTVWVEYPDIEHLCKAIGAAPTSGGYTLPVLRDPNTGTVVSDSWAIAKHLDAHFLDRVVIAPGTDGLQHAFQALVWNTIHKVRRVMCPAARPARLMHRRTCSR